MPSNLVPAESSDIQNPSGTAVDYPGRSSLSIYIQSKKYIYLLPPFPYIDDYIVLHRIHVLDVTQVVPLYV